MDDSLTLFSILFRIRYNFRSAVSVSVNPVINTIRGNRGWMEARESVLSTPTLGDIKELRPIIQPGMSDSAAGPSHGSIRIEWYS